MGLRNVVQWRAGAMRIHIADLIDAALCHLQRALNAAGYSFIDVSVSGTNMGNMYSGFDNNGVRAAMFGFCDAVITDGGHNDRGEIAVIFNAQGNLPGSMLAASSTGLRTIYQWHNDFLRSKLRGTKRVVRTTLAPQTNSTNLWETHDGQTGKTRDSSWVSDYATSIDNIHNGNEYKFNDLIMRAGLYTALPYGGAGECDAGYDFYAAIGGTATGTFPVNGTANWATSEGTHPALWLQLQAAVDLQPRLPALLGF